MKRLTIISTGGTIEKTYDEHAGVLENRQSIVQQMLGMLRFEDTVISTVALLSKDSLDLTDADRARIVAQVRLLVGTQDNPSDCDGVVLLHGTDTLCTTGQLLHQELNGSPHVPVVLTGAMRPFEMKESDALQNLSEAIFAAGLLGGTAFNSPANNSPTGAPAIRCRGGGVWVAAHGNCLRFPGPTKDRARGTFVVSD
ncbi:MAG: L-asparaginase [Phycisphaerales bacterium]|jgi:L-asparaginase